MPSVGSPLSSSLHLSRKQCLFGEKTVELMFCFLSRGPRCTPGWPGAPCAAHTCLHLRAIPCCLHLTMVVIMGPVHMSGLNLMLFITARHLQLRLSTTAAALDFPHTSGCPAPCDLVLTWEGTERDKERTRGPKPTFSRRGAHMWLSVSGSEVACKELPSLPPECNQVGRISFFKISHILCY